MPQIKEYSLRPSSVTRPRSPKNITAVLVLNSRRNYSLTLTLSNANDYYFVDGSAETKVLTFPDQPGETIGNIQTSKTFKIKVRGWDNSERVGIRALIEDTIPSQSLPRIKFLTLS